MSVFMAGAIFGNVLFEKFQSEFVWQAQYSVMLEDDTCCSVQRG